VERNNIIINGAGYTLQATGTPGIVLSGVNNVTIKSVNVRNCVWGIFLWYSSNNTITGNNITAIEQGVWIDSGSTANNINGNNITGHAYCGIYLDQSLGNSISQNTIDENGAAGVEFFNSSNNAISENTIRNNQIGIYLPESFSNNIEYNFVTNNQYGIYLTNATNNSIKQNIVATNSFYGIWLLASDDNSVRKNTITGNIYPGVSLDAASNNSINENILTANSYGVRLFTYSNYNSVSRNNITANTQSGIYLFYSCNYNNITENNIEANKNSGIGLSDSCNNNRIIANVLKNNNRKGISLVESSYNSIYHNNIIGNTQQVYDIAWDYPSTYSPSVNVWDDGYSSGGNYWSNHTDVDEFRGPDQDITGSDGIWDNPHIIDSNNMDRYPLAFPYEPQPPTINILSPQKKAYTVASVPLTFTVDGFDSWIGYSLNGQPNTTITGNITLPDLPAGWHHVVVYANDTLGNMEASHVIHFAVDTTAPTGSITINAGATYTTTTSVTLTLSASDDTSGVAQMRFSNDGTTWTNWEVYATSRAWTLTAGDGSKTVYAQFRDNAELESITYSDTIVLNTIAPTGSIVINGEDTFTTSTSVTLTLTYSDASSGVSQVRYSNDGSAWSSWESPSTTKAWTLASGDGTKTVYYQIRNNAGNLADYSDTIVLDTTAPSGSVTINGGAASTTSTSVMLTLTYTDASSGVSQVRYGNDGATWTSWESPSATKTWTLASGDGTKTVYYQIRDTAGNTATYSASISLQSPAPSPSPEPTPAPTPTPSPPKATPVITVSCRGIATSSGFEVEINGKLSFNGVAVSEEPVLISYSVTGGSSWENLTLVNTVSDGGFLAVWMPSVTGNYLVKAKWEGNSTFNEASTIINLALTPYSEENVFSVTSNSTIAELAFNSASNELSFHVSGPSETTGYVTVYIPKSLVGNVSDLKVYVDGDPRTYSSEAQMDSWVVSFTYSQSVHTIVIDLTATSSETSEPPIEWVITIIIAVATAIAVAAIVFKRKRQHPTNVP
jgi:parallel beta-helix repeat protein